MQLDLNHTLALINTLWVCASVVAIAIGLLAQRRRWFRLHGAAMVLGLLFQGGFTVGFIVRMLVYGTTEPTFLPEAYQVMVLIHQAVSVAATPLALGSAFLGLKGDYELHKEIAPTALVLWTFVSLTGLLTYAWLFVAAGRFPVRFL